MILYRLQCKKGHEFEAWFANSAAYDKQAKRGQLACARCGTSQGRQGADDAERRQARQELQACRASAAESHQHRRRPEASRPQTQRVAAHRELAAAMRKLRAEIESKSEYVGPRFTEEARKIHYEEAPARGIHGEATADEAKSLARKASSSSRCPSCPRITIDAALSASRAAVAALAQLWRGSSNISDLKAASAQAI